MSLKNLILAALVGCTATVGSAQSFEYAVRHRHLLKDCSGVLRIDSGGIEYRTGDAKDNRTWEFGDIRVVEVNSPTEIAIATYEDQKRWAGKDRVFAFTLLDKKATPQLSALLLKHVKRPMKLAVLPDEDESPRYRIPVKHLRTPSGHRGVLKIYSDKVVYESSAEGDSRYWRIADIERFSQPDRFRLTIVSSLPKAGGPTEVYNFQLIEDLPQEASDYLWTRLHPSYHPEPNRESSDSGGSQMH